MKTLKLLSLLVPLVLLAIGSVQAIGWQWSLNHDPFLSKFAIKDMQQYRLLERINK